MKNPIRVFEVTKKNGDKVKVEAQYCVPRDDGVLVLGVDDTREDKAKPEIEQNHMQLVGIFPANIWKQVIAIK